MVVRRSALERLAGHYLPDLGASNYLAGRSYAEEELATAASLPTRA